MTTLTQKALRLALTVGVLLAAGSAHAAKTYSAGASDTEIRVGNTTPYSGPLAVFGLIGRAQVAYFKKLNDDGGLNGRKITFITYDDAYSPPKVLEQVRKLVESDEVLVISGIVGSPTNSAVMKYLNQKKVPQLFGATGAAKFTDPKAAPWTMGWIPSYQAEARAYARLILEANPKAKIGIVFQNDDFGKDYLAGLKDGLAGKPNTLVEAPFETSSPTLDAQIVALKDAGVDAVVIAAAGKFSPQAIRKIGELGWKPLRYLTNTAVGIDSMLKPAGFDHSTGLISTAYKKDPADPAFANDPDMKAYNAFMDKYMPGESRNDQSAVGYMLGKTLEQVLRQCGDDLTRENVMKQAANLKQYPLPLLLPGVTLDTGPNDYSPIKKLQTQRFDGRIWQMFGPVVDTAKAQ